MAPQDPDKLWDRLALALSRDGGRPHWRPVVGVVLPLLWHQGHKRASCAQDLPRGTKGDPRSGPQKRPRTGGREPMAGPSSAGSTGGWAPHEALGGLGLPSEAGVGLQRDGGWGRDGVGARVVAVAWPQERPCLPPRHRDGLPHGGGWLRDRRPRRLCSRSPRWGHNERRRPSRRGYGVAPRGPRERGG